MRFGCNEGAEELPVLVQLGERVADVYGCLCMRR
jgi:hypothetical protein